MEALSPVHVGPGACIQHDGKSLEGGAAAVNGRSPTKVLQHPLAAAAERHATGRATPAVVYLFVETTGVATGRNRGTRASRQLNATGLLRVKKKLALRISANCGKMSVA